MFSISKKSLLKFGLLMMFVLFVVSIVSVTDYVIQAKNEDEQSIRKLQEIQEGSAVYGYDLDQALERLAKMFGIEQSVIRNYYTEGYKIRELYVAGVIGKASGKSLEDIIALETLDKTYSSLVKDLGISKKDTKRISKELSIGEVVEYLQIDRFTFDSLIESNYSYKDVILAGIISKHANKPIEEVILLKRINNTWFEVAADFNITVNGLLYDVENFNKYMSLIIQHPWTRVDLKQDDQV